jgi:hypothetical protein
MKKIFTLLLLGCSTLFARAHSDDGIISITNLSRQEVLIEVDGHEYGSCDHDLTIRDLKPGMYMVKVYGERSHGNQYTGNYKRPLLYNRFVNVKPKLFVDIIINRFSKVFIDEQVMNDRWRDYETDNKHGSKAMNDQSFGMFIETINKENFDDSKMPIIKQVANQNYFTAEQVKQLVPLLTFDDNQLEIAKYLYGRTVDKQNYFIVYSAFKFPFTKDKLVEYIKNYK